MQQKIGILSILYGLYRVPIFCYAFYFIKGGDGNDGNRKQVNENKEYILGDTALFWFCIGGKLRNEHLSIQ